MWSVFLLATTVAIVSPSGSSGADELPMPPMELDDPAVVAALPPRSTAARGVGMPVSPPPEANVSAPTPTVEPVAPPPTQTQTLPPVVPVAPIATPVAPAGSVPVVAPRELSAGHSWLDAGHLSIGTQLGALAGNMGALASVSGLLQADRWNYGVGVLSGTSGGVGLTLVGPRGGVTFLSDGAVDLGASMLLGVGAASKGTEAAATIALQPELVAQLRLTPWLRASAALSWRFASVWQWSGPTGDELGGPALSLGLEFGRFL